MRGGQSSPNPSTTSPEGLGACFSHASTLRIFLLSAFFWTLTNLGMAFLANVWVKDETYQQTLTQARAIFQMIIDIRRWNASHGGVYVPVTESTQPNPCLDVPRRDIVADDGRKLTLINPAYMTRQLSEITAKRNDVRFHITSNNPIRPANCPREWETEALHTFTLPDDEFVQWNLSGKQGRQFHYMAPLWTETACMKCHSKQGYQEGDLRGGISVSIPVDQVLAGRDRIIRKLNAGFFCVWFLGLVGLYVSCRRTTLDFKEKEGLIGQLQNALSEIRTLKGIIPICSSCKKIRQDSGSWEQLEKYISQHSEAQFSHGICPECEKRLYPGLDSESLPPEA